MNYEEQQNIKKFKIQYGEIYRYWTNDSRDVYINLKSSMERFIEKITLVFKFVKEI